MPSAIRVVDRVQDLADWNHASFSDGNVPHWDAADGEYKAGINPVREIYDCPSDVVVCDAVYLSAESMIDRANASSALTCDVIGVVVEKPTSTTAIVQPIGLTNIFSDLSPNQRYWVDTTAGALTTIPPSTTGQVVQQVGRAVTATIMQVAIQPRILL